MTQEQFHDLQQLGQSITEYCEEMGNFQVRRENRGEIAKSFRKSFPNMKVESIRNVIRDLEEMTIEEAQARFDEMRKHAHGLGWDFDHKDVSIEILGIIRKTYPSIEDINV